VRVCIYHTHLWVGGCVSYTVHLLVCVCVQVVQWCRKIGDRGLLEPVLLGSQKIFCLFSSVNKQLL